MLLYQEVDEFIMVYNAHNYIYIKQKFLINIANFYLLIYYEYIANLAKVQFPAEKYFPLSDVDKIKVIDKIDVADSESVFSLHKNALVSEICVFYLNKSNTFYYFFE